MENLVGLLLGWPSLILGLGLAVAGTWHKRPPFIWSAVVLSAPAAFYVSGSPGVPFIGVVPMAALVIAAWTCRGPSPWPARVSLVLYGACLAALAHVVVTAG
jgi:hypothetical protein